MNIQFEDLPQSFQDEAYADALKDYDEHGSWENEYSTVGFWKNEKKTSDVPITLMDATWVKKAIVDESIVKPHPEFGKLRGKVRLAPRGFRERGILRADVASPTAQIITHRMVEVYGLPKSCSHVPPHK